MVEDSKGSFLKNGIGERISLAEEVGHRQDEVRTYERELKIGDLMEEEEVSTWNIDDQQVEDTEQLTDIQPTYTGHEAEKLKDTVPCGEGDLDLEDKAVDWRSASPPLRKLKELDVTSHYREHREHTESFVSVHKEETVSPVEDLVKPKTSATSKIVIVPKKSEVPQEVTLLKQADSVELDRVPSKRSVSVPYRDTVSPRLEQDLPTVLPKNIFPHHTTVIHTDKVILPPKKIESLRDQITKFPKAARSTLSLETPTPDLEEKSFEEERFPAARPVLASREVSPPVSVRIPSPEKTVPLDEEISLPEETVLSANTSLPKAVVPSEEMTLSKKPIPKDKTVPTKKVPLKKKPLPTERGSVPPKHPTQKVITPEVDSSEEARTATTKPPPTTEHDKKAKKGTEQFEQQSLQKGIFCIRAAQAP